MKRSNKILLIAIGVTVVMSLVVEVMCSLIGADTVFLACVFIVLITGLIILPVYEYRVWKKDKMKIKIKPFTIHNSIIYAEDYGAAFLKWNEMREPRESYEELSNPLDD